MRICLACSGGGHLRQILLLNNVYKDLDHYFVTQRTPLAESTSQEHRVHFVPDIALGLLTKSPRAWWSFLRNLSRSFAILWKERPTVILSTGAGTALNTLMLGRLFGANVIFLETFAHTQTPSLTGRLVAPLAHAHLVQWPALKERFPRARVISPLSETGRTIPEKPPEDQRTLVTVGTHGPFDRLIREVEKAVMEGKISAGVVAQVGSGGHKSTRFKCFESCDPQEMERLLNESRLLITHAGTGSILSGLKAGCRVIAITRQAAHGEHYDDHQVEILDEMVSRGAILGGRDPSCLMGLLEQVNDFSPKEIILSTVELEAEIGRLFAEWGRVRS